MHITAISVNHNTSAYMELMLRSFDACHGRGLPVSWALLDNRSDDGRAALEAYAAERGTPLRPSGFGLATLHNSHGEILRAAVLAAPESSHYLFLDADVRFVERDTLPRLLAALDAAPDAFGVGPQLSWDGVEPIPEAVRRANPDICDARLHPCCALVRATPTFRAIVEYIGLAAAIIRWAEREEYVDTFGLLTRAMRTHGLRHQLADVLVQHFFCVSYDYDDAATRDYKRQMRDALLAELRQGGGYVL